MKFKNKVVVRCVRYGLEPEITLNKESPYSHRNEAWPIYTPDDFFPDTD